MSKAYLYTVLVIYSLVDAMIMHISAKICYS